VWLRLCLTGAVAALLLVAVRAPGQPTTPTAAEGRSSRPESRHGPRDLLGTFSLTSERGPVHIKSDELEFDYRARVLAYRGGVTVTQGDLKLSSDSLRIRFDPDARDSVREVVAEGSVHISKGQREATGGRAVFDQEKRTVTLSDDATLRDGPNEVAGERVVVYLDEERSIVEGGKDRVRAVLFPSSSTLNELERESTDDR
jgi:lipopolysaccharide export system protein LptA